MKIIECPRDAMQGIKEFIPTEKKVAYINKLLQVGFDTIDFGSFVSPKAIPQLKDTSEVVEQLDLESSSSDLLAIVANRRGAEDASGFPQIKYLGYPFSISETFQKRNTNATIAESLDRVKEIQDICKGADKELVIYISMGFGNPYGDEWSPDIAAEWTRRLADDVGVRIVSLADTIGVAEPRTIEYLFSTLIPEFPEMEIGAHFHTRPDTWKEKVEAAYQSGCERFDGAMKGFGGCPMAEDELVGNMATENLFSFMEEKGTGKKLDKEAFKEAAQEALKTFP